MNLKPALLLAASILSLGPRAAWAQSAKPAASKTRVPKGYHSEAQLKDRFKALKKARPAIFSRHVIGRSGRGRAIEAILLSDRKGRKVEHKPALLVLGNLAGDEAAGGEAVLRIAEFIVAALDREPAFKALMVKRAIWLIPRPNPDATERLFEKPSISQRRTLTPTDDDKDGQSDEDAAQDLDGDDRILQMRVPKGSLVEDTGKDAVSGLMRVFDKAKGETGQFRLLRESRDQDKDRKNGEDPVGGVDLDRNFPIYWTPPEKTPGAGVHALSENESKALVDFLLERPNIGLIIHVHVGQHGPLSSGKGQVPKADAKIFQALQRLYKESARRKDDPLGAFSQAKGETASGTFQDYCYHGLGVVSWPARIWMEPPTDMKKPGDSAVDAKTARQRRWIRFFKKAGEGWRPWRAFQHPVLGPVEIGGFTPFSLKSPPSAYLNKALAPVVRFSLNAATLLPELSIKNCKVDTLSQGVYRVRLEVHNEGFFPTHTARAIEVKRKAPNVLTVETAPGDRLIAGRTRQLLPVLKGGASLKREFIVASKGRSLLTLKVQSPKGGTVTQQLRLGKGV